MLCCSYFSKSNPRLAQKYSKLLQSAFVGFFSGSVGLRTEFGTEKLGVIDSLTALPREDDVLLFAIPVCAAYSCMQTYKYKAKLTPGSGKRGKAAKQAIGFLVRNAGVPQREKDMIKAIADNELVAAMIGNVKVSMPGFAAAKSNAKKNKKQKAKAKG